jgi:hypothetical protein
MTQAAPLSKGSIRTGQIISGLTVLMLLMDGVMKLAKPAPVVEAMTKLGFPVSTSLGIGLLLILCTLAYAIPRTAVFGAVLLTGYLGGAIAAHVRAGSDLFSVLFPLIVGTMIWGGLLLRDRKLRTFDSQLS